jgi:hypothetical protein
MVGVNHDVRAPVFGRGAGSAYLVHRELHRVEGVVQRQDTPADCQLDLATGICLVSIVTLASLVKMKARSTARPRCVRALPQLHFVGTQNRPEGVGHF